MWKYCLTTAEEELPASFLVMAAWYIASRSFTDTSSVCWYSADKALSWGCPDLDLLGLLTAANTEKSDFKKWMIWLYVISREFALGKLDLGTVQGSCNCAGTSGFKLNQLNGFSVTFLNSAGQKEKKKTQTARWCSEIWNKNALIWDFFWCIFLITTP